MKKDEFHIHEVSEKALWGVRKNDDGETAGVMVPMVEGQNLMPGMELVNITARAGEDSVVDLESVFKTKGPAQVASPQYRENYDNIFAKNDAKKTTYPN